MIYDRALLLGDQKRNAERAGAPAELTRRFDWSRLRVYDLNARGENHGVLLGTTRWTL